MYIQKEYVMRNTIDIEKYHSGRYGAPGEKRKPKKKLTPEQIQAQNYEQAKKKLKRIINANFGSGDYHCTLTYKKENRPKPDEAKKILQNFLRRLSREYKKLGEELKYIVVTEYEAKSIHHHVILNRINETSNLMNKHWKSGRVHFTPLDDTGDYKNLANYLIKETERTFRNPESAVRQRYTRSRNLKIPEPIKKVISSKTFNKIPKAKKGYYIDPDSIHVGVNQFTGHAYQCYTLIKLERSRDG